MEENNELENEELNISVKSKIVNTVTSLLLGLTVVLCLYVVIQVMSHGYASFGGYSVFRVVTGSMEPTIPVGAIILTDDVEITQVEVGDIVCFRAKNAEIRGEIITHRVIGILENADGLAMLQTKGDANPAMDGYYVTQANLVGRVIWNTGGSSVLSDIVAFFTNKIGFLACIAVPSLILAGLLLRDCVANIKGDLEKALEELAAEPEEEPYVITEEEYREMYERIRAELIEELGLGVVPKQQTK